MSKYKLEIIKEDEDVHILAKNKNGGVEGYIILTSTENLDRKNLLEINQLQVNVDARKHGLGSQLVSKAIKYALENDKGIHMMIQPGSQTFWRKYFNQRYDSKRITLFSGSALNQQLADGKVFEISKENLIKNYKFPQDKILRDLGTEKLIMKLLL